MDVTLNFRLAGGAVTAATDQTSTIAATFQDGAPLGTLTSYAVGNDRVIIGVHQRPGGSWARWRSRRSRTPRSGGRREQPVPAGAQQRHAGGLSRWEFSAGRVLGSALELSNVDLSKEFINMIPASTRVLGGVAGHHDDGSVVPAVAGYQAIGRRGGVTGVARARLAGGPEAPASPQDPVGLHRCRLSTHLHARGARQPKRSHALGSSPLFVAVGVVLVVIGALVAASDASARALGLAGVGLDRAAV